MKITLEEQRAKVSEALEELESNCGADYKYVSNAAQCVINESVVERFVFYLDKMEECINSAEESKRKSYALLLTGIHKAAYEKEMKGIIDSNMTPCLYTILANDRLSVYHTHSSFNPVLNEWIGARIMLCTDTNKFN